VPTEQAEHERSVVVVQPVICWPAAQPVEHDGQVALVTPFAEKVPAAQSWMSALVEPVHGVATRLPALVCVQDTHTLPLEYVPVAPPVHAEQAPLLQP